MPNTVQELYINIPYDSSIERQRTADAETVSQEARTMYEDENNLYHYSYRKGNEYDPNVPIDTKNYADEPSDQNRGSGSGKSI